MKRSLATTLTITFLAWLSLATACGDVSKPSGHPDAPPGAHACAFDTDTFDNGCNFGP